MIEKPGAKFIRCDRWRLLSSTAIAVAAQDTVDIYQRMTNAIASVFLAHWPQVHNLSVQDLERFFHNTRKNPDTLYGDWFREQFGKFPAYLRRAATMAAHGAVSSYMTRYYKWQGGQRRNRTDRPPTWGGVYSWPVFYSAKGGADAMIHDLGESVCIKLYDAKTGDWLWHTIPVVRKGRRGGDMDAIPKSPMLIVQGGSVFLAQPYEFSRRTPSDLNPNLRACGVDMGINKDATCSIVDCEGTVIATRFISKAAHIDSRDKVLRQINRKAAQTMGKTGKLCKGFCKTLYRRAHNLNRHISHDTVLQIVRFAIENGASVIVFEDLKHFRPKGGAKRSNLKQKFHGWLHRQTFNHAKQVCEEEGLVFGTVYARGTSSYAYDGSGRVVRSKCNYGRCRFASGKQYDTDLSASYNIAARWLDQHLLCSPAGGNTSGSVPGRSSRAERRTPVTLSSLWGSPLPHHSGSEKHPASGTRKHLPQLQLGW